MTYGERVVAAAIVVVNAVIVVLTTTGAVNWTGEQIALVTVEANAGAGFALALYFHFKSGTKKEPVAISAALTVLVTATLFLLNGFDITHFSQDAVTAIGGSVTAVAALVTAAFARDSVTAPVTPAVPE